ncbi:hypothetical protein V8E36_005016 [Tilletia maclaganii]
MALQALTAEESMAHNEKLREQLAQAHDTITNSVAAEKCRLETLTPWRTTGPMLRFKLAVSKPREAHAKFVKAQTVQKCSAITITGISSASVIKIQLPSSCAASAPIASMASLSSFVSMSPTANLIETNKLDRHSNDRLFYGRAGLGILLKSLEDSMRLFSFAGYLQLEDIRVVQESHFAYKAWNSPRPPGK